MAPGAATLSPGRLFGRLERFVGLAPILTTNEATPDRQACVFSADDSGGRGSIASRPE